MDTDPYRKWFSERVSISDDVFSKFGEAGEPDAEILLCCALAKLAAMRWPGYERLLDKRRFVEFLVRFAPSTKQVSIPIFIEKLYEKGSNDSANKLVCRFFQYRHNFDGQFYLNGQLSPEPMMLKVLSSDQIDQTESEVIGLVSGDERTILREASYAAIMYSYLRCGLVHEYHPYAPVATKGMLPRRDTPSYSNKITDTVTKRYLYFPYEYLQNTVIIAANNSFDDWDNWPEPDSYTPAAWAEDKPQPWWITRYGKCST